jgi:hypothetical protein
MKYGSYCVTLVFTTITMLHTSAGYIVVVIVWYFLLCYTCIHYYYHTSYFSPWWSWLYGSSYCVTLIFTTITMLHTSVRRGRDRIVVLIVLHLYSLLLPYFILQLGLSWSYGSEYKCNTIRTTIRTWPRRTEVWSMVIVVNTSVWSYGSSYCLTLVFTTITMLHSSVCRGRVRMVVLIVLHLYSLLLPCFILQSVSVMFVW